MPSVRDWASLCADYIHESYLAGRRPTRERTAAVIATFAAPLIDLLRESRREHEHGLHGARCCPRCTCESWDFVTKSQEEGELDAEHSPNSDEPCTCGADAWNERVRAVLAGSASDRGKANDG